MSYYVGPLGARLPDSKPYVDAYPLRAVAVTRPTPVVLGVNWYTAFDRPERDTAGRYWIGVGALGSVRGGHAICAKPDALVDRNEWWFYYNQGNEGACVGFSCSRAVTLLNKTRYDARWLYHEAQRVDPWPGGAYPGADPFYEGTSVDAGLRVLRDRGHRVPSWEEPRPMQGISAFRWATTVDEVHAALATPLADQLGAVPLLNSWGTGYPKLVWLPDASLDRLLQEGGEAAVMTDR